MLPVVSVWCDSASYTDTTLLTGLAALSRDAAVGVLTNRNVTGEVFDRVLDRASLSVKNIDATQVAPLIAWRTPDEQAKLVRAALARSVVSAERLVAYVSPAAALTLLQQAASTRFRGAAALRDQIDDVVHHIDFSGRSTEDGYRELVDLLLDGRPLSPGDLRAKAAGARGREDLEQLTEAMAAQRGNDGDHPVPGDYVIDTLLLASHGHPEVVTTWATDGGVTGLLVAASDHRQDPALLASLRHPHPRVRDELLRRLAYNPAVARDTLRVLLVEQATRILTDGASPYAVDKWAQLTKDLLARRDPDLDYRHPQQLTRRQANSLLNGEHHRPALFNLELLTNPHLSGRGRQLLLVDLTNRLLPGTSVKTIVEHLRPGDLRSSGAYRQLVPSFPHVLPADHAAHATVTGDHNANALLTGARFPDHAAAIRHDCASYLVGRLTRAEEYVRLYQQLDGRPHARTRLEDLVTVAVTAPEPVASAGYTGVLGNALGSLG